MGAALGGAGVAGFKRLEEEREGGVSPPPMERRLRPPGTPGIDPGIAFISPAACISSTSKKRLSQTVAWRESGYAISLGEMERLHAELRYEAFRWRRAHLVYAKAMRGAIALQVRVYDQAS